MSIIVSLVGPIEWWWNTEADPARFHSSEAVNYRSWRERVSRFLVDRGYLVYRPHEGFKGEWDERAQVFNDAMIQISDAVINMRPAHIPGKGTDHELKLAKELGKPVFHAPPGSDLESVHMDISYVMGVVNVVD